MVLPSPPRHDHHRPHHQSRFDRLLDSLHNFKFYKPLSDRPPTNLSSSSHHPTSHTANSTPNPPQSNHPSNPPANPSAPTCPPPSHPQLPSPNPPASPSGTWHSPHRISMPKPILTTNPQNDPSSPPISPIRMPIPAHPSKPPDPSFSPSLLPRPPIAFPIPQPIKTSTSLSTFSPPKPPISSNASQGSPSPLKSPTIGITSTGKPIKTPTKPNPSPIGSSKLQQTPNQLPVSSPSNSSKFETPTNQKISSANSPSSKLTPTLTPSTERCSGTTREGKPCSRKPMKTMDASPNDKNIHHPTKINLDERFDELDQILTLSSYNQQEEDHHPLPHPQSVVVPRFCFQHYQKVQSQSGSYFANSVWVKYSDWIPDELPEVTKLTLRVEMSKKPSETDRNQTGYLYCHEMRPKTEGGRSGQDSRWLTTYLKVGRSIRPVARLEEWSKQCPSREPIVRGFFPQSNDDDESSKYVTKTKTKTSSSSSSPSPSSSSSSIIEMVKEEAEGECYLNGIQSVSNQGIRFHRRWERLTLIELNGWQSLQQSNQDHLQPKSSCVDCGKIHLELFQLNLGSFESIVKPCILKWLKFCRFAYL